MPTNHDETLAERYMRELQTELAIYSRMTPEQISAMATELHNALAARDAALAELAEEQALRERMAELLSQSAVALRGPEPPLTRYSYADIPSRVKAVVEELAALKGGQDELQAQKELMEQALSDLWSVRIDKIKSHCMDAAPPAQASMGAGRVEAGAG